MAKKHVISESATMSFDIKQDDSIWIVKQGVGLDVVDDSVLDNSFHAAKNVEFIVEGMIGGMGSQMWNGIAAHGRNNSIEIADTGTIGGGYRAISAFGDNAEIVNHGTVFGSIAGVDLGGENFVLRNFGLITTSELTTGRSILIDSPANGRIINEIGGVIEGKVDTVDSLALTFVNKGVLGETGFKSITASFGYHDDHFVNRGSINGTVLLGGGEDVADLRGGMTTGVVSGADGNDTYIVNKNDWQAYEYAGDGIDTLKTFVNFTATLAGEMEKFVAIGKGNVTIIANALDNTISGNQGQNFLDGGMGDDALRGGKRADIFNFGTGYDSDRILDFENGKDRINVASWDNIDDFADIQAHLSVQGDDLVIAFGNDDLTLRNMKLSDLDATDFSF